MKQQFLFQTKYFKLIQTIRTVCRDTIMNIFIFFCLFEVKNLFEIQLFFILSLINLNLQIVEFNNFEYDSDQNFRSNYHKNKFSLFIQKSDQTTFVIVKKKIPDLFSSTIESLEQRRNRLLMIFLHLFITCKGLTIR